jgi:3-dehydroquinate synthase
VGKRGRRENEIEFANLHDNLQNEANAFVITDDNVLREWGSAVEGKQIFSITPGEKSKSHDAYRECLSWLAENRASRSSTIIALGGGVVGDLAGFVAATYMRGIRLIQCPTTLLSMVDSSVGGKVAIDLPQGKNLVGAFYAPAKVIIDLKTLDTLSQREFNNGAAEIYKYGAILDTELFAELQASPLRTGDVRLDKIVKRCVELKQSVVEVDERETTGRRAILNFGHTVGHAIEKVTGYGPVLHGEAIALGMVVESAIGEKLAITPRGTTERVSKALEGQGLPINRQLAIGNSQFEGENWQSSMLEAMRLDKKASDGKLAFALLTGLGSCKLVSDVPETAVLECLRELL